MTHWHARFRRWYENELEKKPGEIVVDLQDVQRNFPKYDDLKADMDRVNHYLINYPENMRRLVFVQTD